MNYKELVFTVISSEDYHRDLMIHALSVIGYDTFEETEPDFKAYIPSDKLFDIILADINRNILLDQMESYSRVLSTGGLLFISGVYQNPDLGILIEKAKQNRLNYVYHKSIDEWTVAKFIK